MRFTFDKDALLKEIAIAQEVISTKNAISVLSNVLLEAKDDGSLLVKATDIKTAFETAIPVDVAEAGSTTVFCDKLSSILASLPSGNVSFSQEEGTVSIRPAAKKANFQLKCIASDKFPEFTSDSGVEYFDIPARELKKMIGETIFSVSNDELRYFMTGVFMEGDEGLLKMVATDGRRLAFISTEAESALPDFKGSIMPTKILNIIAKRTPDEGAVSIGLSEKNVFFKFGDYRFSSLLIDGQFPNYSRVIPERQSSAFKVDRKDLLEALKRVSLLAEQKSRRVYLNVSADALAVRSQETEIGVASEEIPCEYDGEDFAIALNYLYLDEPMKAMASDKVKVEFTEPMRAVTLRAEPDENFFHVIMPMQME